MRSVRSYLDQATDAVQSINLPDLSRRNMSLPVPTFSNNWDRFSRNGWHWVATGTVAVIGLIAGGVAAFVKSNRNGSSKKTIANAEGTEETLESMTKAALYEQAKSAEIEGRSRMTKEELVEALQSS